MRNGTTERRAEWNEDEREWLDNAIENAERAEDALDLFDADRLTEEDERALVNLQNQAYRLRVALRDLEEKIDSRYCDYCEQFIADPLEHGKGMCYDPGDPGGLGD